MVGATKETPVHVPKQEIPQPPAALNVKITTPLVFAVLIGWSVIAGRLTAAQLDEQAITKRVKDDARAMSGSLLPDPERLGEQWKRPWETPAAAQFPISDWHRKQGINNAEDLFWYTAFTLQSQLPFGLSESEAAALYDDFGEMFARQGGGQTGMTQRQFLGYTLAQRQDEDASAAQKAANMWTVAARGLALQYENAAKGGQTDVRQKLAIEMFSARFAGLSDEQFKAAWVRQMTLVRRYTTMAYERARNWHARTPVNWQGITMTREDEAKAAAEPVCAAIVRLRLVDEERCDELTDLDAADARLFAERLAAAVRASAQSRVQSAQLALDRDIESARQHNTQSALEGMGWRQKIETQKAALEKIVVSVTPKLFGDNSYVIRVTGVSPDPPNTQFGMYTGWIRKGPALAEVSLSGTFPPEELDRDMDHILAELDAKLASYDSCPAKRLDVMQTVPDVTAPAPVARAADANPPRAQADAGTAPAPLPPATPPPAALPAPPNPASAPPPAVNQPPATLESVRQRVWKNDLKGALADSIALAAANPNDIQARALRGGLELLAGDPRTGLSEAEALIKASPNDVWMWVLHAQALLRNNNAAAARQSLARAKQLDPNLVPNLYNQANQILSAGVPAMAHLQYTTTLAADPNLSGAYYGLGFACSQLGMKEQAIQAFEHYLRLDPYSAYAQTVRQEVERLNR